ncbi:MAG: Malate/L-lactate dehydrogenase family protein [Proteobacteria bacterium]|nr:Malate/L-lactate dehydrogenase family protein [Pseudomonadota bacterium]
MSAEVTRLSLSEAEALVLAALQASGCSPENAAPTARALVAAEADGQSGHGLSRVPPYALHARVGKVNGFARPRLEQVAAAALRVDAAHGFAYPAIDLALGALVPLARQAGVALATVGASHHFGQAGAHAERLAGQGLVALVFGNTPKAMAFWGGRRPALGTNPIAFAAPLPGADAPLVIDLALSVAARGKIVAAQKAGRPIPAGWAVDRDGQSTTDPDAALAGALSPIGGPKGAALALMVEILAAALTGSSFGWEASSMFDAQGGPPDMGHVFLAIDPGPLSGGAFPGRMADLLAALAEEPDARLPGSRRLEARMRAARDGIQVPSVLAEEIRLLAGGRP